MTFSQVYDLLDLSGRVATTRRFQAFMKEAGVAAEVYIDLDVTAPDFKETLKHRLSDKTYQLLLFALTKTTGKSASELAMHVQQNLDLTAASVTRQHILHSEAGLEFNELLGKQLRELAGKFNEINDAKLIGLMRSAIVTLIDDSEIRKQLDATVLNTVNQIRQKDRIAASFAYYCGLYDQACARAEQSHLAQFAVRPDPHLMQLVKAGLDRDQLLAVLEQWTDQTKTMVIQEIFKEEAAVHLDLDAQLLRLISEYMAAAEESLPVARFCAADH